MAADTGGKPEPPEPSMEDILASIRRILAEDGGLAPAAPARPVRSQPPRAAAMPPPDADDIGAGLEEADDAPPRPESGPADPFDDGEAAYTRSSAPDNGGAGALDEDIFMLSPDMRAAGHTLVSAQAAVESTDVLSQLARAILDRRDIAVGTRTVTLEDMVREMLRPLLREWLDRNLPYLIERLVKKEIDLMINRAERLED